MKNRKAHGPSGVSSNILKRAGRSCIRELTNVYHEKIKRRVAQTSGGLAILFLCLKEREMPYIVENSEA